VADHIQNKQARSQKVTLKWLDDRILSILLFRRTDEWYTIIDFETFLFRVIKQYLISKDGEHCEDNPLDHD
jgi:hypothetical protein